MTVIRMTKKSSFALILIISFLILINSVLPSGIAIDVVPDMHVIPIGKTVGVTINIGGVMVLGFSDIKNTDGRKVNPAKSAGLRSGDIINTLDGEVVETVEQLTGITQSTSDKITVGYVRNGRTLTADVTPAVSSEDGSVRLGIWVRDNTTGIGTLTYIVPDTKQYGALGHPITDNDTEKTVNVGSGDICRVDIVGITRGERGRPGELRGVISNDKKLGSIAENTGFGIYGTALEVVSNGINAVPIALRNEVKEGEATIVANVENDETKEYSAEIIKLFKNSYDNKSMIIKVTDEELISKTGGIVQGMSGCPILQNGKLVGAITHVLVNEPTKGYGVFIELMIAQSTENM